MTYLALALDGPQLLELTADPALLTRWDALPVAFTVLGLDRLDGAPSLSLDSSAVAAALSGRTTSGRFLFVAAPERDHPYNLARRVASLGHLSRGRSGVLFGAAGAEAARAVRALEQSWPYDSFVGDREAGILVRSDRIVHVDLDGTYRIAGPLNAPEPPTGASVIGRLGAGDWGDLALSDGEVRHGETVAGRLLRPAAGQGLTVFLDAAERLVAEHDAVPPGPLRAALGLPLPGRAGGRPAFDVPQPLRRQA